MWEKSVAKVVYPCERVPSHCGGNQNLVQVNLCLKIYKNILTITCIYFWILVSNNTTGVTSGAGTAYSSKSPVFTPPSSVGFVFLNLSFPVVFCRPVYLLFHLWPLFCLYFDLQHLITPLVSSNIFDESKPTIFCLFVLSHLDNVLQLLIIPLCYLHPFLTTCTQN